jgi:nicotinamidase-related amidase
MIRRPDRESPRRLAFLLTLLAVAFTPPAAPAADQVADTSEGVVALLIIDIQEFYYPGGAAPLVEPEVASANARKLLEHFRGKEMPVVHVGHNASQGKDFHPDVTPREGEMIFMKDEVNAFNGTGLLAYLQESEVTRLVVCGMQTHMCLEAAVRAAHDLGFECVVVADACATRDLKFEDQTVAAADVHLSTLSTLNRVYAEVVETEEFLSSR